MCVSITKRRPPFVIPFIILPAQGRNLSINYWFELHEDKADGQVLVDDLMERAAKEARMHGIRVS